MSALAQPPPLPTGLRTDRPVAWQPVLGGRAGLGAQLEYGAYRVLTAAIGACPRGLQRGLVSFCARLARCFDRRHTYAARRFLEQALGPELTTKRREELVLAAWRHLFDIAITGERFERDVGNERLVEHFELDLHPDVERVVSSGRGAIIVSPHLGALHAATAILPRIGFDPLYLIARPARNRPLSRRFQEVRERRGVWLLPRHGALQDAVRVLRSGGCVAMAADQRAHIGPVIAPFFGRPAKTEQAPALLMRRLRLPIVVGACICTERHDHFKLILSAVLWPEEQSLRTIEETVAEINRAMEELVLRWPEQYMWVHDRYRGVPEG